MREESIPADLQTFCRRGRNRPTLKPDQIIQLLVEFAKRFGPQCPEPELGPERFVSEVLGVQRIDDWQYIVLRAIGRGVRKIKVESCHGPGKTTVMAWAAAYQLCCRFPQKTAATAPTGGQMYDAFYAELKTWLKRLPSVFYEAFEIKADRIELVAARDESFLTARTAKPENPEALQGIHCDAGYVLLIADEMSGIPDPIFESAGGSLSGPRVTLLMGGNPVRTSGFAFNAGRGQDSEWFCVRVSALPTDHDPANGVYYSPRPGAQYVKDMGADYGYDSDAFRVRCRGLYPKSEANKIIPFEWIELAIGKQVQVNANTERLWGFDPARGSSDTASLVERQEKVARIIGAWPEERDAMILCGKVKWLYDNTSVLARPAEILVDSIGLGGPILDRLRELGLPVRGVNVSSLPSVEDRYRNLRTEIWWKKRQWFEGRDVAIPKYRGTKEPLDLGAQRMAQELAAQEYSVIESNGKIMAESKDDMRKLLKGKSPDFADALGLTFASNSATMAGVRKPWNKPIRRNWNGVV